MWGDEEREDAERGMKEEQSVKHKGEDNRREEDRINGVGKEVWQDGEGEQPEVAEREQEREEAKSQDESTEVQVIEGEIGNGDAQEDSQEVLQRVGSIETTTFSDRQDEATAGEKSLDNNLCTPAAENICRHEENTHISLSSERIHTTDLEDRTQENTHPSDEDTFASTNTRTASLLGNANLSDMRAPVSSSPPAEQDHTPHSVKVN